MKKCEGGFTLIEMLVVTAMLAILAIPIVSLFGSSLNTTKASRELLSASYVSQQLVEEVLATQPANRLSLHVPNKTAFAVSAYSYQRLITQHTTGLLKVTVIVYWVEGSSERTYQVVTLVAKE